MIPNENNIMHFRAPAKLILSGEHAVVYGAPALALAVNRYVTAELRSLPYPLFTLSLPAFNYKHSFDEDKLSEAAEEIEQRYKLYLQAKCSIQTVIQSPHELIIYALNLVKKNYQLILGIELTLTSSIPVGSGMGSSAAAIVTTMYAVTQMAGFQISPNELYSLALTAENMQHGQSSGLDLQLALYGGCVYRKHSSLSSRQIACLPLYMIDTGKPKVTTGQCVDAVRPFFNSKYDNLIEAFSVVTHQMDMAWQAASYLDMLKAIKENHRLLMRIGVVPEKVQEFVNELEQENAAAKICGAGAIDGENAGTVLVLTNHAQQLSELCNKFNYQYAPVVGALRGVHEF